VVSIEITNSVSGDPFAICINPLQIFAEDRITSIGEGENELFFKGELVVLTEFQNWAVSGNQLHMMVRYLEGFDRSLFPPFSVEPIHTIAPFEGFSYEGMTYGSLGIEQSSSPLGVIGSFAETPQGSGNFHQKTAKNLSYTYVPEGFFPNNAPPSGLDCSHLCGKKPNADSTECINDEDAEFKYNFHGRCLKRCPSHGQIYYPNEENVCTRINCLCELDPENENFNPLLAELGCVDGTFFLNNDCVLDCGAGYTPNSQTNTCDPIQ
jgi:hypothetical protein